MQQVLVLEHNQKTAERLVAALRQIDDFSVSVTLTMREACLIVAQASQAIAFIPLSEADHVGRALRAFQPDLKLVLTTADPQLLLSNNYRQDYQGLLHVPRLEAELAAILGELDLKAPPIQQPRPEKMPLPGLRRLREACQEVGVSGKSAIKLVVLSLGNRLIGFFGEGLEAQVMPVVELLNETWPRDKITARLQFVELPDYYDARLVYSRQIAGAILSLIAAPETPVGDVRQTADQLAYLLTKPGKTEVEVVERPFPGNGRLPAPPTRTTNNFVIAWRPVKPLPQILQNVVWDCLSKLAADNGCKLNYLSVKADIVHLILECPVDKTAAWAAFVLKSGINEEIKHQFGVTSSIWRKGFYASESTQPLKDAELKMLLAA